MDPHQKVDRKWAKIYSQEKYQNSKDFYFPDTYQNVPYKTVPQFDSIKDCYKKDGCIVYEDNYRQEQLGKYDNYKRTIAVDSIKGIGVWTPKCDENKCKTPPVYRYTYFLKWTSFIVIFLAVTETMIKMSSFLKWQIKRLYRYLRNCSPFRRKKLIGIRILKLHSFDPVKDGFFLTGNVYEREIPGVRTEYLNKASAFKHFFPDSIFTVWDIRDDDIQSMADNFAISLDKRKNPSKIYINTGSKVYEIKIPKPEENKETNRKGG